MLEIIRTAAALLACSMVFILAAVAIMQTKGDNDGDQ